MEDGILQGAAIEGRELEVAAAGLGEQAAMLAAGETTPAELVELSLRRIEATQPTLNAFRVVCAEEARAAAELAQARLAAGERTALLGVPVAIKDDVDLAGHPMGRRQLTDAGDRG